MRLQRKVALITGAAGGIGHAVSELFARKDTTVFPSDITSPDASFRWRRGYHARRHQLRQLEISGRYHCREARPLDVLINNNGIIAYEPLPELEIKVWLKMIAVDQTDVFLGMREGLHVRRQQKCGSIVNISSIWGSAAVSGGHAYHAAKGAVRTMTKNAAMTYVADGIRVNSVHPGFIDTPLTRAQAPRAQRCRHRFDADAVCGEADGSCLRVCLPCF